MAERDDRLLRRGARKKLLKDIAAILKPVMVDGHLALARSVGAGEYWLALNNYASLTVNVQLSGAAIDFWALDPVALFFGSVGVSAQAPHSKAALLGANFMLSREAEQFLAKRGRMPTRADVQVNPAGCERKVEGTENHCHYLRRGRAEEMAGAVQGNLQTEVSVVRNPRVVMLRGASPAGAGRSIRHQRPRAAG